MLKTILLSGLLLASLTTYSQHSQGFSHKNLGLGYRTFPYPASLDTQSVASPRDLLNADSAHKAMVREFVGRSSGQDSVVLTSSVLDHLDATRHEAAGVHVFLGNENGELQVILAHTRIDTLKVNDTFAHIGNAVGYDSPSNYNVLYDQAYCWDKRKQDWELVKGTPQGATTLKQDIVESRKQAQEQYGYNRQGYYLSKDLLLKICKESGQDLLTVFLGQKADVFHLIIPVASKVSSAARGLHYATDYDKTSLAHQALAFDPAPKDHNTIRPCQPYCNDEGP